MRFGLTLPLYLAVCFCSIATLRGESGTICDLFPDLKSHNGRHVRVQAELFLDKDRTATAAHCDEPFVADSLVWATALHLDPGPALPDGERTQLERARSESIAGRQANRHIRVTASLEGILETKDTYPWAYGPEGITRNAYGVDGGLPARILLTRISELQVEVLPAPEDLPVIDVCDVFADLMSYDGKRVAIRGEVTSYFHGAPIFGGCKKRFKTQGYLWPSALSYSVPFHDSRFEQRLQGDQQRMDAVEKEASEQARGRRRVGRTYTVVGTLHTRREYKTTCRGGLWLAGRGFGEISFAPAEFFVETKLAVTVGALPPAADDQFEPQKCPLAEPPGKEECSRLDIVTASAKGCVERVTELALSGQVGYGSAAMLGAAESGYPEVVRALVKAGISPNVPTNGKRPLCEAIAHGKTDAVEALLAVGAAVDNNPESRCGLLGTATRDDPKMIGLLASSGASLETGDYAGATPLMLAAGFGRVANFKALLAAGANPNAQDKEGRTPLNYGASIQREIVEILLKRSVDVDARGIDGRTPLISAAWDSRDDIVRLLLEAGASVNMQDDGGDTALHKAMRSGFTDAIPILLDFGARQDIRNKDGKTPADLALGYQREALGLSFKR